MKQKQQEGVTKAYTFTTPEEEVTFSEMGDGRVRIQIGSDTANDVTLSYDQVVRLRSVILYDLAAEPAKKQVQAVPAAESPKDEPETPPLKEPSGADYIPV